MEPRETEPVDFSVRLYYKNAQLAFQFGDLPECWGVRGDEVATPPRWSDKVAAHIIGQQARSSPSELDLASPHEETRARAVAFAPPRFVGPREYDAACRLCEDF